MGDVFEIIVDGTSGLITGAVGGCIVAGICSKGTVGKGYLLGNKSRIEDTLGRGELTSKVKDILACGGQNPLVIAVPVAPTKDGTVSAVIKPADAPVITVTGKPMTAGSYELRISSAGGVNEATYELFTDGAGSGAKTVPADKTIEVDGLTLNFADGIYPSGAVYNFTTSAPEAGISYVMQALQRPLEIYDVEFVYITGASDSTAWAAAQAKADELFNQHRPTYFKLEARMPNDNEDLNDWAAELIKERQGFAGRWVQICTSYGTIIDASGRRSKRNWCGLQAGRTLAIPVQRAHGRVRDGNISGVVLPPEWNSQVQQLLEKAGYLTAKNYAGLSGAYWGDSRTMADSASDYQYEESVRVTFKALRLCRQAALKSMYDELGDPVSQSNMTGAIYLKTNMETALDTMTNAVPREMADYKISIPQGQDFINNGVATEITLIGIPIIRTIKLFANYTYAGSNFDPRLKG